ncbi:MAG: energy transducer TonB [Pseudomonadota bacterium]
MRRIAKNVIRFLLLAPALTLLAMTYARATAAGEFVSAVKLDKAEAMIYPGAARVGAREGRVTISFDVNTDGTTSDHTVEYSTGDAAFEKALIKEYRNTLFSPAKIDKKPVRSRRYHSMTFYMNGKSRGVSRGLRKDWRRFWEAIDAADETDASKHVKHMNKVAHRSLVDELYLQLAWASYFDFAENYDAAHVRLDVVHSLYLVNKSMPEKLVQEPTFFAPLFKKYQYEARNALIGDAQQTLAALIEMGGETKSAQLAKQHFEGMVDELGEQELVTEVVLEASPFGAKHYVGSLGLYRQIIQVRDINDEVWSITVVCGDWQRTLRSEDLARLVLTGGEESCTLFARGAQGSSFTVVQYAS